MKSTLLTKHTAGRSVLSLALITFGSGCASDPATGGLHDLGGSSGAPASQGGAGTSVAGSGTAPAGGSSSGSTSTAGAGSDAAGMTNTGTAGSGTAGSGAAGSGAAGSGTAGTGAGGSGAGGSGAGGSGTAGTGAGGTGGAHTSTGGGSPGGATGSAGMGGPSLCPVAGTTLCDGFEGAAPGAAGSDWTTIATGGTITVDSTKAYRGTKSIKYSATAASPKVFLVEKKTFTGTTKATNNEFWARYFVLSGVAAVSDYAQGHAVFGTLADSADASDPNRFHFVGGSRAKLQPEIRISGDSYTDSMTAPAAADPSFPIASDGWQCWEFHVTAADNFDFYINGQEVMEMQIVAGKAVMNKANFSPLPIFGQLQIGWQYFGTGNASGWIDEVAIGPNRIPCNQ